MTKAAALDYAKKNIRVNAVGPGPVETPLLAKGTGGDPHSYAAFVPMGRIGQPDEIADCRGVATVRRSPLRHRPYAARRWRRLLAVTGRPTGAARVAACWLWRAGNRYGGRSAALLARRQLLTVRAIRVPRVRTLSRGGIHT